MAEGRVLEHGDAVALARFLDEPHEQFGTRVTIAERGGNGRVIGARDAHVWQCSLALHSSQAGRLGAGAGIAAAGDLDAGPRSAEGSPGRRKRTSAFHIRDGARPGRRDDRIRVPRRGRRAVALATIHPCGVATDRIGRGTSGRS
jgi:hypothetical protein